MFVLRSASAVFVSVESSVLPKRRGLGTEQRQSSPCDIFANASNREEAL